MSGSPSGSVRVCAGSHAAWRPNAASATPAAAPSGKANRLAKAALPAGINPATAIASQATATASEPTSGEDSTPIPTSPSSRLVRRCRGKAGTGPARPRKRRAPCLRTRRTSSCAARDSPPSPSTVLELRRIVSRLDAGEHRARAVAGIERELQELVRAVDVLGFDDSRDAEVDFVEVVDRDDSLSRRGGRGLR